MSRRERRIVLVTVPGYECQRCGLRRPQRGRGASIQCTKCKSRDMAEISDYPAYRCVRCCRTWVERADTRGRGFVTCNRCAFTAPLREVKPAA